MRKSNLGKYPIFRSSVNLIKTDDITPTDLTDECGAGKTLVLTNPVYNDLITSASNLRAGASAPAFVAFKDSIYANSFINGNSDLVYGSFEMQHDYKEGTDLEVHLH